jgi:hypothetical protein
MSETKGGYHPEWATKIDVARRQICAAIRMFFERRDPVVGHSVISAGHQILTDVGAGSDVDGLLRGKGKPREHITQMNFAANFFKHADRDSSARINIEPLPQLNAEFLMDAVVMLQRIAGEIPTEAKIFWSWFVSKHGDLFESFSKDLVPRFADFDIDVDDFDQIAALLTFNEIKESAANRTPTAAEGSKQD